MLVVRGLECSCTKSRRGAGGGAVGAGAGAGSKTSAGVGAGAGAGGWAAGTGDVRTTPLLRAVTDNPVTTRTDTGEFGSSSVDKTLKWMLAKFFCTRLLR